VLTSSRVRSTHLPNALEAGTRSPSPDHALSPLLLSCSPPPPICLPKFLGVVCISLGPPLHASHVTDRQNRVYYSFQIFWSILNAEILDVASSFFVYLTHVLPADELIQTDGPFQLIHDHPRIPVRWILGNFNWRWFVISLHMMFLIIHFFCRWEEKPKTRRIIQWTSRDSSESLFKSFWSILNTKFIQRMHLYYHNICSTCWLP
jgi:hypothetical protein